MSNYFLLKWVDHMNKNYGYFICIRRSIVNPSVPFDQIRAGERIRVQERGSKVVRFATVYMRSDNIHPLFGIRELIKQHEDNQGSSITNDADCYSVRCKRINGFMEKIMQQLTTSLDNPANVVELGMRSSDNNNNNKITTTSRRNQSVENDLVPIGSGLTKVRRDDYEKVNWRSYTIATRTLLCAVFPRSTLATHSLTGKKSPAFQNKPAKMCLDERKTSDVIIEIMNRFKIKRNLIRNIITIKCADECKMKRTRDKKKAKR